MLMSIDSQGSTATTVGASTLGQLELGSSQRRDLMDIVHYLTMFDYYGWTTDESLKDESKRILHYGIAPWAAFILPIISPGAQRVILKVLSYLGMQVRLRTEQHVRLCGCFSYSSQYMAVIEYGAETRSVPCTDIVESLS